MTEATPVEDREALPVLEHPADGVPAVADTPQALAKAVAALAAGTGSLAVDTERAHGFRYSPRAYLLQFRRAGAGTQLIDPIPFGIAGLKPLAEALTSAEWILHAASQDLPCLADLELIPATLFDTELAARLLGRPRVALATLIEEEFGLTLRKEHSASDWSQRPLPSNWLTYAALDVELLIQLRERLEAELIAAGKDEWARQEFAHLVAGAARTPPVRVDPWRRTSGLHAVRTPRGLAVVRELWTERDAIAAANDRAPGKVLADRAITQLAARADAPERRVLQAADLDAVSEFKWRQATRYRANWLAALERAGRLTRDQLPPRTVTPDGPPPTRTWEQRNPEAAKRWEGVRPAVADLAESLQVPTENLLSPDLLRRLAWEPPLDASPASVDAALAAGGARQWQRELVAPVVAPLL